MSKASTLDFEVLKQPSTNTVTNVVGNGDFETNAAGWTGNGATLARITSDSKFGSACLQITLTGTGNAGASYRYTPGGVLGPVGTKFIYSGWVKTTSGRSPRFRFEESGGAIGTQTGISAGPTANGDWQFFSLSYTLQQADRTNLDIRYIDGVPTIGNIILLDGVQVEQDNGSNGVGLPSPLQLTSAGLIGTRTYPQGSPSPVLLPASSTTKQIVVATINAASTISSSVVAKRAVLPSNINAASSLSGRVIALRRVIASNINATSSLNGNVVAHRAILSASISATSALSGRVIALKHITSGNITATSSLSSSIIKTSHLQTSNINAASTLSGSVTKLIRIAGNINAISTLGGSLVVKRSILPTGISATSTVSGTITSLRFLSGNINAASTLSSAVGALRKVSPANINATPTLNGNIGRLKFVVNTGINATSVLSGNLNTTRNILSANINGTSTITGQLSNIKHIVPANIIITTDLNGNVRLVKAVTPDNVNATSTISGGILKVVFHGPLITFDLEIGNRSWYACVTKQSWSATSILPIRDWNVRV